MTIFPLISVILWVVTVLAGVAYALVRRQQRRFAAYWENEQRLWDQYAHDQSEVMYGNGYDAGYAAGQAAEARIHADAARFDAQVRPFLDPPPTQPSPASAPASDLADQFVSVMNQALTSMAQIASAAVSPPQPTNADDIARAIAQAYDPTVYLDPSPTIDFDPSLDGWTDEYGRTTSAPMEHARVAVVQPGEPLVPGVPRTDPSYLNGQ